MSGAATSTPAAAAATATVDLEVLKTKISTLSEQIVTLKKSDPVDKDAIATSVTELLDAKKVYAANNNGIGVDGKPYEAPMTKAEKKAKAKADKAAKAGNAASGGGGGGGGNESGGQSNKNKAKNAAKALAKAEKEAKKNQNRLEREERERIKRERETGVGQTNFGDVPLIQSKTVTDRVWTPVGELGVEMEGKEVLIRGHLHTSRLVGKMAFVLVRSSLYSVQGLCAEVDGEASSKAIVKYVGALPVESVVEVRGIITLPAHPIDAATQQDVEIQITQFHCVSKADAMPFQMEDACRPDCGKEVDVGAYDGAEKESADGLVRVGQEVRLDNRWLDLRTPANQSIFRIEGMIGHLFRCCLMDKGFVEIHTPKLLGGASEGGSDVFTLNYFGQKACLAMSPQLHKQMTAACSGFEKVFEVGPVFRAENSNTRRHLCEFTGLDFEMCISEHYDEVLDVFSDLFIHIFDGINERCKNELERVREQHPFEDLKYLNPTLKITYAEGCALLREAGVDQGDYDDLSTLNEKKLGQIVKEKYDTDFFFMDKYPIAVRPFYTMPCPENDRLSNSYDFFIRGQEILSGAQRIHEPDLLETRAKAKGIPLEDIKSYVDSFRHGALPHGGGGIGLERVVMLFLGLPNIRKSAWFPRDPKRLSP